MKRFELYPLVESDRLHTTVGSIVKEPTRFIFEHSNNIPDKFLGSILICYSNNLWTANSVLAIKPLKTELILFTRKYKIPRVFLPSAADAPLVFSDRVKYLELNLDRELTWKPNI